METTLKLNQDLKANRQITVDVTPKEPLLLPLGSIGSQGEQPARMRAFGSIPNDRDEYTIEAPALKSTERVGDGASSLENTIDYVPADPRKASHKFGGGFQAKARVRAAGGLIENIRILGAVA